MRKRSLVSKALLFAAICIALPLTACNSTTSPNPTASQEPLPEFDQFNNKILRLNTAPTGKALIKDCKRDKFDDTVSYKCPANITLSITRGSDPEAVSMMSLQTPKDSRYSVDLNNVLNYSTFKWNFNEEYPQLATYSLFVQDEKKQSHVYHCEFPATSEEPDFQPCLDHLVSANAARL